MLFNSYEFIFLFIPLVLIGFQIIRRYNRQAALAWLTLASLVFYAWWRPINLFIIVPSIIVNYLLARWMLSFGEDRSKDTLRKGILAAGVAANLMFLGYFKYLTFFQASSNDLFGTDFVLTYIILPLGISFITFQKIAFLVDVHGGKIKDFTFREFALFVLFFPQLIAGPIVHFREMMPQYRELTARIDRRMLAVGMTLFCMGLFKKVILADGIALYATPVYQAADIGTSITMIMAWIAALGFTLQIYFDFSGYSDMAAGLALAIGFRLPLNFDSPLKARNIIDFWGRWHVTLTRFLTAYVYNPITLSWTRRRLKKGKGGYSPARPSLPAFLQLLAVPTLLTMLLSGLWHGAGYTFILWGGLHGLYLCINHGWRLTAPARFSSPESYQRWMNPMGFVITFLSVTIAMVLFRASTVDSALHILAGMTGVNGLGIPENLAAMAGLGGHAWLVSASMPLMQFVTTILWLLLPLAIALMMPNSLQLLAPEQPVLNYTLREDRSMWLATRVAWQPSLLWLLAIAVCLAAGIMKLGGQSEFLYWQF